MQLTQRSAFAGATLVQFAAGSTLLPQNVAEMVTNLALLARVSIKSTAFFIELILETAKYGTGTGLGLTRRALISAVGTARAVHALRYGEEWDAREAGNSSVTGVHAIARLDQKAAFLSVLDKYTALGVYLIHHTFTLAELFAQSGFSLVDQSIKAGLSAADESVRVIDGIFGSNETSRALSCFITMVKSELSDDELFTRHTGGGIWTITALTKALTTFAVLQNATFRRTVKTQKTRVIYDCLVLGEAEVKSWRSQIVGSGNFVKKSLPALPTSTPTRTPSSLHKAYNPTRTRLTSTPGSVRSGMSSMRRSRSIFGVDEPCITDLEEVTHEGILLSDSGDESRTLLDDLDYLVGAEEEDDEDEGYDVTPTKSKVFYSSEICHDDLPKEVRSRLSKSRPDEVERGVLISEEGIGGPRRRDLNRIVRRKREGGNGNSAMYEITTETTEVIEETTTTMTTTSMKRNTAAQNKSRLAGESSTTKMKRFPNPFQAFKQERELITSAREEEDWTAVDANATSSDGDVKMGGIPEVPNGRAAAATAHFKSVATSKKDASPRPEEARQTVQEVVRTITKRLVQRKKTIRQVQKEDAGSDEEMLDNQQMAAAAASSFKRKGTDTPKSSNTPASDVGSDTDSNLQRVLGKAKTLMPLHLSNRLNEVNRLTLLQQQQQSGKQKEQQDKDLPQLPSPIKDKGGSVRRRRHSRAQSIGSMRSFASHSRFQVHSTQTTKNGLDIEQRDSLNGAPGSFPRQHLVMNLRRFMRHSSAAYGQNFMRVLGIGDTQYLFADTRERNANIFAYAHHVGIPPDAVLLSSYCEGASLPFHSEKMAPIVNYISRDDVSKAIVLTCRGTLGLSDILTDLTCTFVDVQVEDGKVDESYQVHSGMMASAQRLAAPGHTVLETLRTALESNPDYGLVLTGHSLGGGVGLLLAMLLSSPSHVFRAKVSKRGSDEGSGKIRHPTITTPFVTGLDSGLPPGRAIHAYAYGPPAVSSADLSRYCRGLCTSVVHGFDVVPTLSLGTLHDLKAVACSLSDEKEGTVAQEIVGKVVGLYKKKKERHKNASSPLLSNGDLEGGDDGEALRTMQIPLHEREIHLNIEELAQGFTKNRAADANYLDPNYSEEDRSPKQPQQTQPQSGGKSDSSSSKDEDDEQDLNDWFWSLIKTMRASMDHDKLYPPGEVYLMEMQQVHVTAEMSGDQHDMFMKAGKKQGMSSNDRVEAARVIVRLVEDVTSRFREPIFARSLFRDHLPTNYELVTQLLWEAIVPKEEQERVKEDETQAASSNG
ncbi:hypothetical protein CBS101457_001234 [Exobasidium rhododendri]|nr:hypothetical protein CBS101457_001234 [Exobasidium rhododendri]